MKITFFSNFINHHQIPLAEELYQLLGEDYTFVATEPIPQERLDMGYEDQNKSLPYVLTTYDSEENRKKADKLIEESDVVIVGSAPDSIVEKRLPLGKLTFHSSERYFKEGIGIQKMLRNFASAMKHIKRFEKYSNYYYLCMSAYTAADVNTFANYDGRLFKWGYFPEVKEQNIEELLAHKDENNPNSILWVGRFIEWKHPDDAICVAEMLKEEGYSFNLNLIGTGMLESHLQQMIRDKSLEDCVHILGAMSPQNVRTYMEDADIFLFTSDFNEGWGAVLNEAMNSACGVVASHAIGSVPFLLENQKNGLVYENGNFDDLKRCIKVLLDHPEMTRNMGEAAYDTMRVNWNAKQAARRLIDLCENLNQNKDTPFEEGPCSTAAVIKQKDMYHRIMEM